MTPHLLAAQAVTRSLAADGVQLPGYIVDRAANAAVAAVAEWERTEAARYDREHGIAQEVDA